MLHFLFIFIFSLPIYCFTYYPFSDDICPEKTIWIEGFGSSKNSLTNSNDMAIWTGLLLWKKYINDLQGICLDSKNQNDAQCSTRMKVCMKFVEIADFFTTEAQYKDAITKYVKDLVNSNTGKPHFLIAPSDPGLTNYTFKAIATASGRINIEGINILVFSSVPNDDVYMQNYKFMISPVIKLSKYSASALELFAQRYHIKTAVFLADRSTSAEYTAISNGVISNLEANKAITFILKMCSKSATNAEGQRCRTDADCPAKETCQSPEVRVDTASINQRMNNVEAWMRVLRDLNPDLLILGSSDLSNILLTLQTQVFLPKATLGFKKTIVWTQSNEVGAPNMNWHFFIEFDESLEFGRKGKYMGTTSDYFAYIKQNFKSFTNDNVYPDGIETFGNDFTMLARGSSIGVTIQKIVELCSFYAIDLEKSFQSIETFNKIRSATQEDNFKLCIDPTTKVVTQPCLPNDCASGCVSWEPFYGSIAFDTSGTNAAKTGVVAQVQQLANGTKEYELLSPTTISHCNKDGKSCSKNYHDCTCLPIYPAVWPWEPHDGNTYLKLSSAGGICLFLLSLILFILIITIIIRVIINMRQWNNLFLPYSTGLYLAFALTLTFSTFTLYDDRTSNMCTFDTFTLVLANLLLFVSPTLTFTEENTRLVETSSTLTKSQGLKNLGLDFGFFTIVCLFIFASGEKSSVFEETYFDTTHPYNYNYCILTDLDILSYVLSVLSFLVHVFGSYYYRHHPTYYFRSLNYYFTCVTALYIIVLPLESLITTHTETYFIVSIMTLLIFSCLYIYPFVRISSLFRLRKADELYRSAKNNKIALENLFRKKLDRSFFYCFLAQEGDQKCFELYEDIQTYKTKTVQVEINEMKRIIFTNHFSSPSIHSNLGFTTDFISCQRQELDKNDVGCGFQMTEDLIVNYLASKHYFERFQLSDFYKPLQSNHALTLFLKKHSVSTLLAIYEYVKVSIIVDTTKDPEVFHQHVAFYNQSIVSKSSMFRSSISKNPDAKTSILPKKKESISYLDSGIIPSELEERKDLNSETSKDSKKLENLVSRPVSERQLSGTGTGSLESIPLQQSETLECPIVKAAPTPALKLGGATPKTPSVDKVSNPANQSNSRTDSSSDSKK